MELAKKKLIVSRRRIGRIMKEEGLVSSYTVAQYKPHVDRCNESKVENIVKRNFQDQPQYELSDYVNWFNNHRIHSSLDYMTPVEYRENALEEVV